VALTAEAGLIYVNTTLERSWEAWEGTAVETEALASQGSECRKESDPNL
jgi:hypothetical protein